MAYITMHSILSFYWIPGNISFSNEKARDLHIYACSFQQDRFREIMVSVCIMTSCREVVNENPLYLQNARKSSDATLFYWWCQAAREGRCWQSITVLSKQAIKSNKKCRLKEPRTLACPSLCISLYPSYIVQPSFSALLRLTISENDEQ